MSTWDQIQTYCKSLAHRDAVLPCQSSWTSLHSIEMHTAGEPLRVILQGFPALRGRDILEKRRDARQRCDFFRKALIWEPRGHADMYGCLLVEANDHQADFGILFAREQIRLGEEIAIESILGTRFSGSVIESVNVGSLPAVIPRVSGNAYVVGRSQFWIDPGDPLQPGFLLH